MFILHAEKIPDESTEDFAESDEEGSGSTVLLLTWHNDVEEPGKSHNWIYEYCKIVNLIIRKYAGDCYQRVVVSQVCAQERMFRVGLHQGPVHEYIPPSWISELGLKVGYSSTRYLW